MKLYGKEFRMLAGKTFKITSSFPFYRQGFNKNTNKMDMFVQKDGEWKQKVRDGSSFVLNDGKPSFKLHKKVYDIEFITEKPVEFDKKNGKESDNKFIATLSAHMIGDILKATIAFGEDIPQNNGRDAFDWEESWMKKLPGTYVVFSVTGEGLGTKYTFKEGKIFQQSIIEDKKVEKKENIKEEDLDDEPLPF